MTELTGSLFRPFAGILVPIFSDAKPPAQSTEDAVHVPPVPQAEPVTVFAAVVEDVAPPPPPAASVPQPAAPKDDDIHAPETEPTAAPADVAPAATPAAATTESPGEWSLKIQLSDLPPNVHHRKHLEGLFPTAMYVAVPATMKFAFVAFDSEAKRQAALAQNILPSTLCPFKPKGPPKVYPPAVQAAVPTPVPAAAAAAVAAETLPTPPGQGKVTWKLLINVTMPHSDEAVIQILKKQFPNNVGVRVTNTLKYGRAGIVEFKTKAEVQASKQAVENIVTCKILSFAASANI